MTEDEAKTKWCPFARVGSGLGGSYNRDTQGVPPVDRCIGSGCMAWRWAWRDNITLEPQVGLDGKVRGYCGLACKP